MYLQKFIYVNWGNIPHGEFEFGPTNLFSGGNGSGKTTAADAIQTVMTAAHDGLFHFNPGQDESTQRGRGGKQVRTLASYILGCDDGAYARPDSAFGYLAAIFVPSAGEDAEPFTALLAMSAFVERNGKQAIARLDELQFYLLPGVKLALADVLREDKSGRYVLPLNQLQKLLIAQYGHDQVEKYERKKAYLCRLYGALRGKSDAVSEREALNAARAFSRFMAYKPIKAIDEFVANEVLEPRDVGDAIRDVSAMLKRIHTMESDAKEIRVGAERLLAARTSADSFIEQWLELQLLDYARARLLYNQCQGRYLNAKREQSSLQAELASNERDAELAQARLQTCRGQIRDLELERLQVPALRDKDQLAADKAKLESALHKGVVPLLAAIQQLQRQQQGAVQLQKLLAQSSLSLTLPKLGDKRLLQLMEQIARESNGKPVDIHQLANQDWIDLSPLEDQLDSALKLQQLHSNWAQLWLHPEEENLQQSLRQELDKRRQSLEKFKRQLQLKQQEISQLESRQVVYPNYVRVALEALRKQLPDADARVLCDHVEVVEPDWQSAIEGYIGGARFGIIVEPEYEAQAIALVRALPGRDNRARIVQGSKAAQDAGHIQLEDSIVAVMTFTHEVAKNYLSASYGQVKRVEDAQQLRHTRRGVTREAMGSGNYALFRCDLDDGELVFGHSARERALNAKQQEAKQLLTQWQHASDSVNEIQQIVSLVQAIKPTQYADLLQQLLELQRELNALDARLQNLDLSDHIQLQAALDALLQSEREQQAAIAKLNDGRIELKSRLLNADKACGQFNHQQDDTLAHLEAAEANLESLVNLWPDFNSDTAIAQADDWAQSLNLAQLESQGQQCREALGRLLRRLDSLLMEHNVQAREADRLLFEPNLAQLESQQNFDGLCKLQRQLDGLYNRFKNNILASRQAEISEMRASFNNAFVTNLCHAIYQAINDGKRVLEQLNVELEGFRFGADRERFYFGYDWVPEFREYWQFFKAVIDNPALDDGESLFEMKLERKQIKVRDKLMAMLLDDDEQKALRELNRIADYRNYRRYEIYKEPEGKAPIALSEYGTGSGGQLETPAYIIRSAAITSAFRFSEGRNHLRMVLVDEAFSKMDEHRSREVINYLNESLGLQLMFIMPSSKSGPFLDLVSNQFVFSKCATDRPMGELRSRVLVDRQVLNREAVANLMQQHRQSIKHQAHLDFLDEVAMLSE